MQTFTGIVQQGSKRAAVLGYPTINIPLPDGDVSGIYAARVYLKDEAPYIAAAFADFEKGVLEAHILDFSDDVYGLEVRIDLYEKLRETAQYTDDAALKIAIAADIAKVREYFKN